MMPVLSAKEDEVLNYHMITAGMYLTATISKVNADWVALKVNDFVKGNLHLEHMSDTHIKVMPPKYREAGKSIRVRVLHVDQAKRYIEFTKKDSFLKDDAPVYQSYRDVNKGDKVLCNVVSTCEYGLIIKSFGNIKGLITYEDIKAKHGDKDQ